jgi:hypothetical protein
VLTTAAAMEVAAAAVGGKLGGLRGLSFALLAIYIVEGLVTTPPVLRSAFGHGRHRRRSSSTATTSSLIEDGVPPLESPSASYVRDAEVA